MKYCEDEKTFRLEDLLTTFHDFCKLVQQCRKVLMPLDHISLQAYNVISYLEMVKKFS